MSKARLFPVLLQVAVASAAHIQPTAEHRALFESGHWDRTRYTLKADKPKHVHIAYAGRSELGYPTGVNVGWTHKEKKDCHVEYGLSGGPRNMTTALAHSSRYLSTGSHHYNIDILGLQPGQLYDYAVLCKGHGGSASKVYTFRAAENKRDLGRPYTINVFGDMGWLGSKQRPMALDVHGLEKNWSAVPVYELQKQQLEAGRIDAMWLVGDIAYADDAFAHDVVGGLYEKCMDGFMQWQQKLAARVPYHVSVGNHESECHSPECVVDVALGRQLANFSAYNTRWHMPSASSGGVLNMWYSWNVGPVHFVSVNTETDFEGAGEEKKGDSGVYPAGGFAPEGEYLRWLEADLRQAYAEKKSGLRPFIVVGGHRPCKHDCAPKVMHSLFKQYEVDLFISGHAHKYARSFKSCLPPVCKSSNGTVAEHTTYIYSGASGGDETAFVDHGPTFNTSAGAFETTELSTGFLTIFNSSALRWRLVSPFGTKRVIDELWVHA